MPPQKTQPKKETNKQKPHPKPNQPNKTQTTQKTNTGDFLKKENYYIFLPHCKAFR